MRFTNILTITLAYLTKNAQCGDLRENINKDLIDQDELDQQAAKARDLTASMDKTRDTLIGEKCYNRMWNIYDFEFTRNTRNDHIVGIGFSEAHSRGRRQFNYWYWGERSGDRGLNLKQNAVLLETFDCINGLKISTGYKGEPKQFIMDIQFSTLQTAFNNNEIYNFKPSYLTSEEVYYKKSCLVGFKGLMSEDNVNGKYLKDFEPIWQSFGENRRFE